MKYFAYAPQVDAIAKIVPAMGIDPVRVNRVTDPGHLDGLQLAGWLDIEGRESEVPAALRVAIVGKGLRVVPLTKALQTAAAARQ